MKTRIILIRHGESVANEMRICAGQYDVPLTEYGWRQAVATGEYLKNNEHIDAFYSSDLIRAYDTAMCTAVHFNKSVTRDKRLREISRGEWEGMKVDDIVERYKGRCGEYPRRSTRVTSPGGETPQEVAERTYACIKEIAQANQGKTVAIGFHGTAMRLFCSKALNISTEDIDEVLHVPHNASLTYLDYEDGAFTLNEFSRIEHLKTRLIFIRHGQSEANVQAAFAGHTNVPLSELGVRQGACTGEYLKNEHIDVFYSSDLKRAYDTASLAASHHKLEVHGHKGFREIFAGAWEGVSFADIGRLYPEQYGNWKQDIGKTVIPGGEALEELQKRFYAAAQEVAKLYPGKTVCIGTHALALRSFVMKIIGARIEDMHTTLPFVMNAAVTRVEFYANKFHLVKYGECQHLVEAGLVRRTPSYIKGGYLIGKEITVRVDRPLGTYHPEHKELLYEVNYGYVEGVMGGDGEAQDAYILGVDEPLESFTGRMIAIVHRIDDNEDKWVVAPEGASFTKEQILEKIFFQERFFKIDIVM